MPSNSDLKITVTDDVSPALKLFSTSGNTIGSLNPTGLSIKYGVNAVPYAVLDLTPADLFVVCDIEKYRRAPVKIRVTSKQGCLTFNGLIDGLSISQSTGDMRMQLVVKSPFQLLSEINPKLLGYHSAGVDFTNRVKALEVEDGSVLFSELFQKQYKLLKDRPLITGLLELVLAIVESQLNYDRTQKKSGTQAIALIESAKAIGKTHLETARLLIGSIDTSYVKMDLTMNELQTMQWGLQMICETRTNLLDVLLSMLDTIGCALVIGNEKAFVVPNSGFLKQQHETSIAFRAFSTTPNVLYPMQYDSLSFSDNGYRDIRGVYIMADNNNIQGIDGFFEDTVTGGKGGITGEVLPYVLNFNNVSLGAAHRVEVKHALSDKLRTHTGPGTGPAASEEAQHKAAAAEQTSTEKIQEKAQQEALAIADETIHALKDLANQWAKLRYFQLKYTDRLGGINTMFNPNHAPGCVGSVYLRHPGVHIDFFVTEVAHEIRMATPDSGAATTHISFNCGRMGSATSTLIGAGLDRFDLFNGFDTTTSGKVAEAFISDVSK